jgi:AcrR family transcriptional regulator
MPKAIAQSRAVTAPVAAATPGEGPIRPTERGEATRARIISAAIDLLAEGGWAAITTRGVAERASVNAALVHYHFGSIAQLLEAAITSATETALGEPMQMLVEAPTLREGMRGALVAVARIDDRTMRIMVEVLVRAGRDAGTRAWFVEALRTYRQMIAERVEAAQQAGELPPHVDAASLAVILAALGDGLALHLLIDRDLALDSAIEALDQLMAAAATSPADAAREAPAG